MNDTDVLVALEQALPGLRPAEQRIARAILESPSIVGDSTITQLAAACGTSTTTVARFVTALGFAGYPELRMAVSAAVGRAQAERARFSVHESDVDPNDSAEQVVAKIAYQEVGAIEQTAKTIDLTVLDAVVDALDAADRIDLFGVASSGLAAQDLQQKLHRIGLVSHCWFEPHLALTSAALLTDRCVAIAFSHSGVTLEAYHVLQTAAAAGATTVAVTNFPDSHLTERQFAAFGAPAGHDHVGPAPRQLNSSRLADAGFRPGHDDRLVGQVEHRPVSRSLAMRRSEQVL